MLLCSFKSLGHPGRRFGRGFVIAASAWTSLHILNITLQVRLTEHHEGTYRSVCQRIGRRRGGYVASASDSLHKPRKLFYLVADASFCLCIVQIIRPDHGELQQRVLRPTGRIQHATAQGLHGCRVRVQIMTLVFPFYCHVLTAHCYTSYTTAHCYTTYALPPWDINS